MPKLADSPRVPARHLRWLAVVVACSPLAAALAAHAPPSVRNPHGKFQGECALCHSATGWKPAKISPRFDHSKFGFPLEGAHAASDCRACHTSLDFSQQKQQCVSCHEDIHRGELGTECARCHTSRSFIDPATMQRRHQLSRFPLTGSHAALECESCHRPVSAGHMQFVGTQADCYGCHAADYRAARTPDHVAGGFPQNCTSCHGSVSWHPARFDHERTRFPLTGAHRTAACASCHGDGVYAGKSTACVSCHQSDYDGTTNPAHAAAQFSTACQTCHNTSSWDGASFDHDTNFFPIYSGRHAGLWSQCATCHNVASNYSQFTCFSCHPHSDPTQTQSNHGGVSGYTYTSQACYSCHPRGQT